MRWGLKNPPFILSSCTSFFLKVNNRDAISKVPLLLGELSPSGGGDRCQLLACLTVVDEFHTGFYLRREASAASKTR